jgi:hypothetical protein
METVYVIGNKKNDARPHFHSVLERGDNLLNLLMSFNGNQDRFSHSQVLPRFAAHAPKIESTLKSIGKTSARSF